MKKLIIAFLLIISIQSYAQNMSNYSNYRDSLMAGYHSFRTNVLSEYESYRNKINADYVNFLRSTWLGFSRNEEMPKPDEDIQVVPPIVFDNNSLVPIAPIINIRPDEIPKPTPQPTPKVPIEIKQGPTLPSFNIIIYGTGISLTKPNLESISLYTLDNQSVARAWEHLSSGILDVTLYDCLKTRKERKFNDWAYLNLLNELAEKLAPQNPNLQTLILGYLYSNSGYQMKIGRSNKELFLLFASKHQIYKRSYFVVDGIMFYPLKDVGLNMDICPFSFPHEVPLSLLLSEEPIIDQQLSKVRGFKSSKGIECSAVVNENLLQFYASYPSSALNNDPLSRWSMVCNMPLCGSAKRTLYPALKNRLHNLSLYQQVDLLLNFVQTAFEYEYDDKIWGGDRAFFPDEVLFYPYSDCEDRTSLFTRLVRDLVGLECAIIYYPGHLAAAVRFPQNENIKGDKVRMNGSEFVICDPTYINSSVGMSMPGLDISQIRALILR